MRRETVEHPFGTLKMRMGATHFLMKRLPKVATEMALHVLAYNLTRVMNIVGVQPLMAAMPGLLPGSARSRMTQSGSFVFDVVSPVLARRIISIQPFSIVGGRAFAIRNTGPVSTESGERCD